MIKDTTYHLKVYIQRIEVFLSIDSISAHTRIDLENEKDVASQCLRVCENAESYLESLQHSQASLRQETMTPVGTAQMAARQVYHHQKVHTIGEAFAEDDSDLVVVTTIADRFHVGKAKAKNWSANLAGSMTDETLRMMSRDRYSSRFGAATGDLRHVQSGIATSSTDPGVPDSNTQRPDPVAKRRYTTRVEATHDGPSPNEARKRAGKDGGGI